MDIDNLFDSGLSVDTYVQFKELLRCESIGDAFLVALRVVEFLQLGKPEKGQSVLVKIQIMQ